MNKYRIFYGIILIAFLLISNTSCDDNNPLNAFSPEIINNTDSFEFQITDAVDLTVTESYSWVNTGTRASIDHSTSRIAGTATIRITDANDDEVYISDLLETGTDDSAIGVPGTWKIIVAFTDFDGTSNFRVEKL